MSEPENLVVIEDLSFAREDREILSGVNLDFQRKKVTAIMGPSGSGKTTLLHLIVGQVRPSRGNVIVKGFNVPELSSNKLQKLRRHMGMLFQGGALFTDLNVFDNVAFLLREHTSLSEDLIRDLVLLKLEAVGLRGAAYLQTNQLSGGMARRVALARATMLDPELMIYDEPFAGQDPINRGILLKLIRELNDALGMTTILVTHDVNEVAQIADYVYVIADAKVIAAGTPTEVMQNNTPWVQQFVQGLPDGPVSFRYPAKNYVQDLKL